jgi:LysM repeat protein
LLLGTSTASKIHMKYLQIIVFTWVIGATSLFAQENQLPMDTIVVNWHGGFMSYQHTVKKGETLYSLCRKFNTTIDQVYQSNPHLEGSLLSIDEKIWVPVKKLFNKKPPFPPFTAVMYRVQRGETIFRIARVYLNTQIDHLMAVNGLEDTNIKPGQLLLIGWLPGAGTSSDAQLLSGQTEEATIATTQINPPDDPTVMSHDYGQVHGPFNEPEIKDRKDSIEIITIEPKTSAAPVREIKPIEPELRMKSTAGLAFRIESNGNSKKYFALHNQAKINSYIEVTNPMFNNKVLAKVIGKIPGGMYASDIDLIVSPAVAKDLGVLDRRFYVRVKYLY